MKIEFTGRQLEVPSEIQRLAQRKLGKLARVLPGITRAHVILAQDKHRQIAEVSVHSPHLRLTAVEESTDLRASLATVIDKLTRQAQRQRGRRWESKRRGSSRAGVRWAAGVEPTPRVVRRRRAAARASSSEA